MFTDEELEELQKGLKRLVEIRLNFSDDIVEKNERIYQVWRDTVHEILKKNGCPCLIGDTDECFLSISKKDQIELFEDAGYLSYKNFYNFYSQIINSITVNLLLNSKGVKI